MKAIVDKKDGEILMFCNEQDIELFKNKDGILIMDAKLCPTCKKGWVIRRRKKKDEND